jgi:amidase
MLGTPKALGGQIIGPFMEDLTAIRVGVLAGEGGLAPSYANVIAPPNDVV